MEPSPEGITLTLSTTNLEQMPDVETFRRISKSIAMLDAILCPRWDFRYFSFNARWAGDGTEMASMRDGGGNEYFAIVRGDTAILKGFDHESEMTPYIFDPPKVWPGVLDEVPASFSDFVSEPAFSPADTTFCIWNVGLGNGWELGRIARPDNEEDGSESLLWMFDGGPNTYRQFAQDYFEVDVELSLIEHIFALRPLSEELLRSINPETTLASLSKDIAQIDYPAP
jgi:hypothetical protein